MAAASFNESYLPKFNAGIKNINNHLARKPSCADLGNIVIKEPSKEGVTAVRDNIGKSVLGKVNIKLKYHIPL